MDKLYNVTTWTDFKTFRKQINSLISTATSEKIAEKTKKRFTSIAEGKIKFLKNKIGKEPYNSFFDDFYKEYGCGWLGKEKTEDKQSKVQRQIDEEEERKAIGREIFESWGMDIPDELKPRPKEYEAFSPIADDDEDLPF